MGCCIFRAARVAAFFGLSFLASSQAAPQNGWRMAAALRDTPGRETVNVRVDRAETQALELTYAIPELQSEKTGDKINGQEQERLLLGNAPRTGHCGEPVLPTVPAQILLPAGFTAENIQVTGLDRQVLSGAHLVEYGQRPIPLIPGARVEKAKPNPAIYNSAQAFPDRLYDVIGVQRQRGSAVLVLALYPVQYVPATGELSSYGSMTVRVTLKKESASNAVRFRPDALRPAAARVDNPNTATTYTPSTRSGVTALGVCTSADSYAYVIVTREEMRDATGPYALTNLLAHKQSCGLTATIVTMEDIDANYSGTDQAEKLRNFILDAYNNWETDYVLLAGDTNIVPMRKLRCEAYSGGDIDDIPSDLYYQCLDGPYDYDGDGLWGEPTDGTGGGDVDLVADIYIGRASAETTNEMENFVYKTLAYEKESETAEYLHAALMCGEYLGFGGVSDYAWSSMEEIRTGSDAHGYTTVGFTNSPLFNVETLYDTETNTWTKATLIGRINSGRYSIINHLGHANYNYVMKFYNADADGLTNNQFLFAYSQGCIPGNFEEDCVAEHLTTSTRHGMYAVVFNSRYGWGANYSTDGPSQRFDRQFWDAYFGEKLINLGALNADSHEDNLWDIGGDCIRWCYYESNLLGDPQTPMRGQFILDAIIVTPGTSFSASGAAGGPFSPSAQTYYLFGTATNGTLEWTASCTSSWVSLSATNGSLGENERALLILTLNTNAEQLAEGEYFGQFVFLNKTTGKGSVTQSVHLVVNNPPHVSALSVQDGDTVAAGDTTITIGFDQPMSTMELDQTDFELRGEISGVRTPSSWAYHSDTKELTLNYSQLADDRYTLTLFSGDGRMEDEDGFDLDGETLSWPIPPNQSGDGIAGGDLKVTFEADAGVILYGARFAPVWPLGSLVYDSSMKANLSTALDEDRFTILLDGNQTVTIVVAPHAELRPLIRLYGPSGAEMGAATATTAGADAVLQAVSIPTMGTYTVAVAAAGSMGGLYTMRVVLNAAEEMEEHGGPTNDTLSVAQNLDGAFTSLSGGVSRAAVLGYAARGAQRTVFEQSFESGLGGFVANNNYGSGNGLWHLSTGRQNDAGHSFSHSVYYGQNEGSGGGGDYNTGVKNGGAISSPSIHLPEGSLTLSFNMFSETEGNKAWDVCTVDVGVGGIFTTLLSSAAGSLPVGTGGAWTNITLDMSGYGGTNVALRFTFDTKDSTLNGYEGWYVDDVQMTTYEEGLPDDYSFTLAAGEPVTLMTAVSSQGAVTLQLCDGTGAVLAEGVEGSRNGAARIDGFVAPSAGTYVAKVSGRNQAYNLVILRGGEFEWESNQPENLAQPIDGRMIVLGSLAVPPLTTECEPNDDGLYGFTSNDLAVANDWSGSFQPIGSTVYQATLTGDLDAGWNLERDLFKFCASPGDIVSARVDHVNLEWFDFSLYDRNGTRLDAYDYNRNDQFVQYSNFTYSGAYYLEVKASGSSIGPYTLGATLWTTGLVVDADDDDYAFEVEPGDLVTIRTFTPADGPGEFPNAADPAVELYNPEGLLVAADDHGASDGRNVLMSYRAVVDGVHVARLRAADAYGEYVFQVEKESGPPVVTFGAASYLHSETDSVFALPVLLSAATSDPVTVQYGVMGGTATGGGVDYTLAPGTLTFLPGMTETNLLISIHNDSLIEGTETILVGLSNVVNAFIGQYPTSQVVIVDDENPLQVQFSSANYDVEETATSAVVWVTRVGGLDGWVRVDYAATNGTAASGTDFTPVTGSVVIAEGSTSASFVVPIHFDVFEEPDETISLSLANPCDGVILGSPTNAILTIRNYNYPHTNMLRNAGLESPTTTNAFSEGWSGYGYLTREDWAAHSGSRGGNFQGWVGWEYGYVYQNVSVTRGTYTFSLWVRREVGFNPYSLYLEIYWYDSNGDEVQENAETVDLSTVIPGDGGWHQVYLTSTCTHPALARAIVELYSFWGDPTNSPSGFMFDDVAFYGGVYTGIPALANGSFEGGLTNGDKWRGSSWYATPENLCNTRETWAKHDGSWGGALYGWVSTSNQYATAVEQNLIPGTGTYTLALWIKREPNFLLTNAQLRIGWYGSNYTSKVQADSVTNLAVPADNTWHEYFITGTCTNPNVFEVRPALFARYLYNSANVEFKALEFDDARFVRGVPDADGDGLPDPWENAYFGGSTNALPDDDSDDDTFSNWQEYLLDSDPGDSQSCLEIVSVTNGGGQNIEFLCSPNRCYDIEFTTNPVEGNWQNFLSRVPGDADGLISVKDTNAAAGFRLYRIQLCPP